MLTPFGWQTKNKPSKYRHIATRSVFFPPLKVECNLPVKFLGNRRKWEAVIFVA